MFDNKKWVCISNFEFQFSIILSLFTGTIKNDKNQLTVYLAGGINGNVSMACTLSCVPPNANRSNYQIGDRYWV